MEEFSGGMHFYDDDDDSIINSSKHFNENGDNHVSHHYNGIDRSLWLEDDIRSYLGFLPKLFPDEQISIEPLAYIEAIVETLKEGIEDGTGGVSKLRTSSALFGVGLIARRYDPTKEDGGKEVHKVEY
ncbi:hypothetical protein ACHAW6_002565 [Cyclotella cf. meneghiniana]